MPSVNDRSIGVRERKRQEKCSEDLEARVLGSLDHRQLFSCKCAYESFQDFLEVLSNWCPKHELLCLSSGTGFPVKACMHSTACSDDGQNSAFCCFGYLLPASFRSQKCLFFILST